MKKYLTTLFILCLLLGANVATAEKIVLQLNAEHGFQFAGYYAAKWQGFYRDVGLDVDIRSTALSDGRLLVPIDEVNSRRAQFAVGATDILVNKDKGLEPVVLAPIFQRSPNAVFSLSGTGLDSLAALAQRRIAVGNADAEKIEVEALFRSRGYDINNIDFVNVPVTIASLLGGKADVIVGHQISTKMRAKAQGIELDQLNLADFGMPFYGDTLYTTHEWVKNRREMVEDFVAATKKGWRYALANNEGVGPRIFQELPIENTRNSDMEAYSIDLSETLEALVLYPQKDIGDISQNRWYSMNEQLRMLGVVHSQLDSQNFFFDNKPKNDSLSFSVMFPILLIFLIFLVFVAWYKKKLPLTLVVIVFLMTAIEYQIEVVVKQEKLQSDKLALLQKLNSISAKLGGNLQTNLSMLLGFSAYISAEPNLTYEDFRNYAKEIFKKEPMLINFAAAKDLEVNFVYPLKGNEKVIGLDYKKHEKQRKMVMQTVNSGKLQVVGPVNLVQGGVAFIGRAPIFTGDGANRKLWGIISAPLDAELLYQHSDLRNNYTDIKLALRRYDSLGNEGPVFYGDKAIFEDPDRLQNIIAVGGGTWHVAAVPVKDKALTFNIVVLRLALIIATSILCAFVIYRFRQVKKTGELETTIRSNQRLLENVGRVAKIGGWKVNADFAFTQWSKQSSVLLGEIGDYVPETLSELAENFSPDDFSLLNRSVKIAFKEGRPFDIELELKNYLGRHIWLRLMASPSVDKEGGASVTGTLQDVSDKVASAKYIEHQATYDSLTDLPNRMLFNDRLSKAINDSQRFGHKVAVLFIDLDRFKPVNDNHGHQFGDKLLIEAARRIKGCLRESDTVSRLSGDEFGVLIANVSSSDDALTVAEHILDAMHIAFDLGTVSVYCSASIGIAICPDDATDAESLIRKADQAMYEVKDSGRNGWHFYTQEMQQKSEYRHALLNQLIVAIRDKELMSYYQPIVDLQAGRVVKCESLARWEKADGSFVPPFEFIGLAEESGLINEIDLFMLENSAQQLTTINGDNGAVELSINVSPRLFHTKDRALDRWLACIEEIVTHVKVTVEITERLLTHDSEKALHVLEQLKELGVKIAIDDFGTGYSSLSYLIKFPVDLIKIDRAFISEIGEVASAESLIETVLIMARRLDIQVVAEGIETEQQLQFLKKHGCDFGQGYYLGRPMPSSAFQKLVND